MRGKILTIDVSDEKNFFSIFLVKSPSKQEPLRSSAEAMEYTTDLFHKKFLNIIIFLSVQTVLNRSLLKLRTDGSDNSEFRVSDILNLLV